MERQWKGLTGRDRRQECPREICCPHGCPQPFAVCERRLAASPRWVAHPHLLLHQLSVNRDHCGLRLDFLGRLALEDLQHEEERREGREGEEKRGKHEESPTQNILLVRQSCTAQGGRTSLCMGGGSGFTSTWLGLPASLLMYCTMPAGGAAGARRGRAAAAAAEGPSGSAKAVAPDRASRG